MSTVQYFTHEPLPTDSPIYDSFAPSREISPGCLDLPPLGPYTTAAYYACIGLSTKNNSVDIVVSDPYGWLVVPKDVPSDIDFVATTIGSSTKCRAITPLCDLNHVNVLTNSSGPEGNPSSRYLGLSYECKRDKAGLDLVGNISATVNATTDSGFQIVEYTDSTMTTTSGDTDLRGPTLWYAAIVLTPVDEILICSTELSDVVRCPSACGLSSYLYAYTHYM